MLLLSKFSYKIPRYHRGLFSIPTLLLCGLFSRIFPTVRLLVFYASIIKLIVYERLSRLTHVRPSNVSKRPLVVICSFFSQVPLAPRLESVYHVDALPSLLVRSSPKREGNLETTFIHKLFFVQPGFWTRGHYRDNFNNTLAHPREYESGLVAFARAPARKVERNSGEKVCLLNQKRYTASGIVARGRRAVSGRKSKISPSGRERYLSPTGRYL